MKKLSSLAYAALALLALPLAQDAAAHDFWLSPESYTVDENQVINVSVLIGHPDERMKWPVDPHRIISLRSLGPNGVSDHQSAVADFKKAGHLPIMLKGSGLHILTIETTHAVSELEAEKFNDYVDEEGLTPIKLDRIIKRKTDQAGTEIYSRRGKALIRVGELGDADLAYLSQPLGLTLEIVPNQLPSRVKAGEDMTATIFYRGERVRGVTIGLINLEDDTGLAAVKTSDSQGKVSFARPDTGSWMLHAVWSDPLENSPDADYDTVFSSLSFSVD